MADDDPLSTAANALAGFANGPVAGATGAIEAAVNRSFNAVSNTIARAAISGRDSISQLTASVLADFDRIAASTPRLKLGQLVDGQEMDAATINDALIRLDVLSDACFKDKFVNTPPASPADGDTYLLGASPTGAWSGYAYKIAYCLDGGWRFFTPFDGMRAVVATTGAFIWYQGGSWSDFVPAVVTPSFAVDRNGSDQTGLSVNTTNAIAFNHVAEDNKGWFNTATGRYTPQQAGLYMIVLGVSLSFSSSPSDSPQAYIFKNGALLINGSYAGLPGASSGAGSMAFGLVRFNGSSDYVEGRCFIPTGTSAIRGGISQTFLQGFRVGD